MTFRSGEIAHLGKLLCTLVCTHW